jgi:hypothetical protein
VARRGKAWRGKARRWQGPAWQGKETAGRGKARPGVARQGDGKARRGKAWRCVARRGDGMETNNEGETMEQQPTRWPLDVRTLRKGQRLTPQECAEILGKPEPEAMDLLGLREYIMDASEDAGLNFSVRVDAGGIRINEDAEASEYHARECERAERKLGRNFRRLCRTVDASALNDEQRAQHETSVRVQALKVAALRGARKEIANEMKLGLAGQARAGHG